jgi:hypothetical protein
LRAGVRGKNTLVAACAGVLLRRGTISKERASVSRPAWLLAQNLFFICGASGCYRPRGALISLKRAILGLKIEIGIFTVYMPSWGAPGVYTKSVPPWKIGIYQTSPRGALSGPFYSKSWYIPGDDCGERAVYTGQNPPAQKVYTRAKSTKIDGGIYLLSGPTGRAYWRASRSGSRARARIYPICTGPRNA